MDKADKKVMKSIRSWEPLCEPFIKLSMILKTGGIKADGYLGMCGDRISGALLIDGEDRFCKLPGHGTDRCRGEDMPGYIGVLRFRGYCFGCLCGIDGRKGGEGPRQYHFADASEDETAWACQCVYKV